MFGCFHLMNAEHLYVRNGLTSGARNGSDWNNAWGSLDQIQWGAGVGRVGPGDTCWIAGGTYSSRLVIGASGLAGSPIQVNRVRSTDSIPTAAAGWSPGFDSQVVINSSGNCISFDGGIGSYVTVDGRVPSGIRVNYVNGGSGVEINGGIDFTDIQLKYIEAAGPGPVTQISDTRGFDLTSQANLTNLTVAYCEAHHSDTLIQVTRSVNLVIEYCDFHHAGAINAATYHPNTIYLGTVKSATIRYNKLREIDVEGLFFGDPGNDGVKIYGNLFYQGSSAKNSGRGIEFDNSADSRNVLVYNNTFVDLPLPGLNFNNGKGHPGASAVNNIFFNCSANFGPASHDYNYYSGANPSEPNGVGGGTNPFVNAAAFDYHVVGTIAAAKPRNEGLALGAEYQFDRDGVLRGSDGLWDIGAYEYGAGGGPVNSLPTISSIPNQTGLVGAAVGPVSFTVGDAETVAGSLTLSGSSSNQTLVANAGITFGGSGTNRTVSLLPSSGQTGSATITVAVSDGQASSITTFVVSVSSGVNTSPTISVIANQSGWSGVAVGPIAFTVADAESAASSLVVSGSSSNLALVPVANLVFGGSDANRTLTVTPAANQVGSATITVLVNDGLASASRTFTLTVTAPQVGAGLVAAYGFGENAGSAVADSSGNGNAGQISGATWTSAGKFGSALAFNGTNSLVVVNSSPSLSVSTSMTVEAWVFPAASQSGWRTIVQKEVDAYFLHASGNGGLMPAAGGTFAGAMSFTSSASAIPVSGWSHLAMTYDGANVRLYVNGVQVASKVQTGAIQTNGSALRIGGNVPYGEYFQGIIDEVRVYNRAISVSEILADMQLPIGTSVRNTAPTVSSIANQTIITGLVAGPTPFTVGDAETSAANLALSGSSSNPLVVPNSGITFGGSGANRTVTVTPVAGQIGSAVVTVFVSDGVLSTAVSYTVTVTAPPNTAPSISTIANQSINAGTTTGPLALTLADTETPVGSLALSGTASDTALVPAGGIIFGGTGSSRTVTVTPAAGRFGAATITIVVSDGSLSKSSSFSLMVNGLPTISSIPDQTTTVGMAVGPTGFTVGDAETSAVSLQLSGSSSNPTLVSNTAIVFGGSGANRTVTVTPSAGLLGSAVITVSVSDGSASTAGTYSVTVNPPPNTAPTISMITNQSINANTTTGPVAFSVGDAETASGGLVVSGTASDTALVPAGGITFGGTGSSRTLTITPTAGRSGSATITVQVSDGLLSRSTAFSLTVNGLPTISPIPDQTTTVGLPLGPIAFTVGDSETSATSLQVSGSSSNTTLLPIGAIVFGGSGANRTVTVTPASGQIGSALIAVAVSDGAATTGVTFSVTVNPPPNTAPTLSTIANQAINANTTTGPVGFTVGDAETPAGDLIVSGITSDTALVPAGGITIGGTGSSRTVTITPAAGRSGSAEITIMASDGSLSGSETFALVVNGLPTISSLPDQTTTAGVPVGPIGFTVGDAETFAASLQLSGTSSNPTLVPTSAIVFGGSGSNRTVTVSPLAGQIGAATIGVLVSDGMATAQASYLITVNPTPNSAPVISTIADQTTNAGVTVGPISFTVGDAETSVGSLTLSCASSDQALLPNSAITIGGSGANRTVTLSTVAGQSGQVTVTITLSDGSKSATTAFRLLVNAPPGVPGLVAAYSFDENAGAVVSDISGNGNTGTISGATWTPTGKYGSALNFNGSNSLVVVKSSASLNLSNTMTLSAWAYPTAAQSGWRTIVQKQVDAYFLHAGSNSALRPAGGGTFNGKVSFATSPSVIPVNSWTHLAVTYDGASVRLFVNGLLVATKAQTGVIETNGNGVRIGGNVPYGEYFKGLIDEVRVYNRALTAVEIKTDMQTPIAALATSAVAWEHIDIGAVGLAGADDADPATRTIAVKGSGADIGGTRDAFRYLYQAISGDCVIEANVTSITNTHPWAKAGVMIRESLAADARNVFAFATPSYGSGVQTRSIIGGGTSTTNSGVAKLFAPTWVRLVRTGDTIAAFVSADGMTWTPVATSTVPMAAQVYIGFAVTSHENLLLATGAFADPAIR